MDYQYTNGVIAVKEQKLLGGKLFKMCDAGAEDAFRMLAECGYGGGCARDLYDAERLVEADERDTDEFIMTYAPSVQEKEYFLSERDFHNGKAALKAAFFHRGEELFAPDGLVPRALIEEAVRDEKYDLLPEDLAEAVKEGAAALKEGADGRAIGALFEKALYAHLAKTCKKRLLKKLIAGRADRINLLTAVRANGAEEAKELFLAGGTLKERELLKLAEGAEEARRTVGGELAPFVNALLDAKAEGKPFVAAERMLASFEAEFFAKRKYDLDRDLPFLYYVFRRRIESANVRILFVCLRSGLGGDEIVKRLRTS